MRSNSSSELLNKLSGEGDRPDPNSAIGTDLSIGQREMDRLDRQWQGISKTAKDPMDAYIKFASETEQTFKFNDLSRESYWGYRSSVFPGSDAEFERFESGRIETTLKEMDNDTDRQNYLTDTLDKGPAWMGAKYEPVLASYNNVSTARDMGFAKDLLRSEHGDKAYNIQGMVLDPSVSTEVHTEDVMHIVGMGLDDMLEEQNGRFGIMYNGEFRSAASIESREELGMAPQAPNEAVERTDALYDTYSRQVNQRLAKSRADQAVLHKAQANEGIQSVQRGARPIHEWLGVAALQDADGRSDMEVIADVFAKGASGFYKQGHSRNMTDLVNNDFPAMVRELDQFYGGK